MALHLPSVGFLALLLAAASAVPMPYPLPVNFSFGQCGDLVYPGCTTSVSMVRSLSLQASLCPLLVALPGLPQYVRVCFVSPTLNPVLHAHPHTPILHSRPLIIRSPPPSPFALLSCFSIPTRPPSAPTPPRRPPSVWNATRLPPAPNSADKARSSRAHSHGSPPASAVAVPLRPLRPRQRRQPGRRWLWRVRPSIVLPSLPLLPQPPRCGGGSTTPTVISTT